MKKFLLFLLIILPVYLFWSIASLDKQYFICPIEYKSGISIRSDARGDGFFASHRNGNRLHEGIDLRAEIGRPVLAVRSGVVIAASRTKGMGNYVIIRHRDNLATLYGHLSEINVYKYQRVKQGQLIGKVGKTGNANFSDIQPHLHFEVRKNGQPQDPGEYLQ